jgi:hypothetical protein
VWHWLACDALGPEVKAMKRQRGMLASRLQFHAHLGSFPIFSGFKIPGCFGGALWARGAGVLAA